MSNPEEEFKQVMLHRYSEEVPKAIHHSSTRVIKMIHEHGALDTVRRLMQQYPNHDSEGYEELWKHGRLDLSLEALMLDEHFAALFKKEELEWARKGLADYKYAPTGYASRSPVVREKRHAAGRKQKPMADYAAVFRNAWRMLLRWRDDNRFAPENEEAVQCFLYFAIVSALKDARFVKPKPTTDKPQKLQFHEGKLDVGNMHFPDFIVGEAREVVAELKFVRFQGRTRSNVFADCKRDISKMKQHHPKSRRFFVLYDMHPKFVFLDTHQLEELKALDPECELLLYPEEISTSPAKARARAAIKTMKDRGDDFHELGKRNAAKAVMGKK
jgi:hypothetical protein